MAWYHAFIFFIICCFNCIVCQGQAYERLMEWGGEYNDNISNHILAVKSVGDGRYVLLANLQYYYEEEDLQFASGYSMGSGIRLVDSKGDTLWNRAYRTHTWPGLEFAFHYPIESANSIHVKEDDIYVPFSILGPCYYDIGFYKGILKLSLDNGDWTDYKVFMGDTLCRHEEKVYLSLLDDDLIALHSRDGVFGLGNGFEYTSIILDKHWEVLSSQTYSLPPYQIYGEGFSNEAMKGFFWGRDTIYDWEYPEAEPHSIAYRLGENNGNSRFFCTDFQRDKVLTGLTKTHLVLADTVDYLEENSNEYRNNLALYQFGEGVLREAYFEEGIIRDVEFIGNGKIVVLLEKIKFGTERYWYLQEEKPVRVILMDDELKELGHRDYGYDYVVPRDIEIMDNDSFIVVGYQSTAWFQDSTARSKDLGYFLLDHLDNIIYSESNSLGQMELMPNPSNGFVILQLPEHADLPNTQVHIYDVRGRLIRRIENLAYHRTEIDISAFPSGMYLVSVIDASGNVETKRLIKR